LDELKVFEEAELGRDIRANMRGERSWTTGDDVRIRSSACCGEFRGARFRPDKIPRRLFVKSYGCQMNVYDARKMADILAPEGYAETTVWKKPTLLS